MWTFKFKKPLETQKNFNSKRSSTKKCYNKTINQRQNFKRRKRKKIAHIQGKLHKTVSGFQKKPGK